MADCDLSVLFFGFFLEIERVPGNREFAFMEFDVREAQIGQVE